MKEATISTKGQIVIPKYLRNALGLHPGKTVLLSLSENRLIIIPKPDDPIKGLENIGAQIPLKNIRREIKEE